MKAATTKRNPASSISGMDMNQFRLRPFVERLIQLGEVEIHDEPLTMAELGAFVHDNPKAVLFRKAGPEQAEIVSNVMGSRSRLAAALGVAEKDLLEEFLGRLEHPQPVVEVPSSEAPVHEVILQGDDADFTRLPVYLQHGHDGAPYISAGIDFTVDPETGRTNTGYRRLMLRGRKEAGFNLSAPTDLKAIYLKCVERGERLPVSFVVGSHPVDCMASVLSLRVDEISLIASLRGAPLPTVKSVSNDIMVPADAEYVLEGYFDEQGYVEPEGPYAEFMGYYGAMKKNPVFHLTAVTRRHDALFQSVTISGKHLARTETAQIPALATEVMAWKALQAAIRQPVAVYCPPACNGIHHVRVSMRQTSPGEARKAISAIFGMVGMVKHVFVVDEDVDIFSEERMEWALSTRFQADQDLVILSGMPVIPLDPSLGGKFTGSKAGFDLTRPFGKQGGLESMVPTAPQWGQAPPRFRTVREALESGPMIFSEIMEAVGSRDGREIVLELDQLRQEGRLTRLEQGQYALAKDGGG